MSRGEQVSSSRAMRGLSKHELQCARRRRQGAIDAGELGQRHTAVCPLDNFYSVYERCSFHNGSLPPLRRGRGAAHISSAACQLDTVHQRGPCPVVEVHGCMCVRARLLRLSAPPRALATSLASFPRALARFFSSSSLSLARFVCVCLPGAGPAHPPTSTRRTDRMRDDWSAARGPRVCHVRMELGPSFQQPFFRFHLHRPGLGISTKKGENGVAFFGSALAIVASTRQIASSDRKRAPAFRTQR